MQFGYSNTPLGTARAKGPQEVGQLGVATGRCAFSRASLDSHLDRGASEVEAVPAESEVYFWSEYSAIIIDIKLNQVKFENKYRAFFQLIRYHIIKC